MNSVDDSPDPLLAEVATRLARLRSGAMSQEEMDEFQDWLSDPEHAAAMAEVERVWHGVEVLRAVPSLLSLREQARRNWAGRRTGWATAAAAVVLLLIGSLFVRFLPEWNHTAREQQELRFATSTGQRSPIILEDGSTVMLDAESAIRVRMNDKRRRIELERGRAFFDVAHDVHRPFLVGMDGRTLTALGTSFSVNLTPKRLEILMVKGRVRVTGRQQDHRSMEIDANSRLLVSSDGRWTSQKIDGPAAVSWTRGQLVFDDVPLSEIVEESNRYSTRKLTIASDEASGRHLSAIIKAGDVDTLVEAIVAMGIARARVRDDGTIVLS